MNDLLLPPDKMKAPPKLDIKKDAEGLGDCAERDCRASGVEEDIQEVIDAGLSVRKVTSTKMNVESSRSHLIFSLIIETTDLQTQTVTKGKLSFVDLAGSERLKKSGATGDTMKEASHNKSLSALGNVISALATEQAHIPYRDHKLTMLMSDSLGGNAKTLMFVNVSPTDGNLEETQNSLTYATRVRTIKNGPLKTLPTGRCNDSRRHWRCGRREQERWRARRRRFRTGYRGDWRERPAGAATADAAAKLWAGKTGVRKN